MSNACLIPSNPDTSGPGVRIAIYAQNLICFIPAVWAIWDGHVTDYELESAETQSTTNLVLAFAILISCIVQALTAGLSNFHASIVLSMSWMNNTNAFIYFLLYVQFKGQKGAGRVEARWSDWTEQIVQQMRTFFHVSPMNQDVESSGQTKQTSPVPPLKASTKLLFRRIPLLFGSLHLSLLAALGVWLWSSPSTFGSSDAGSTCAFHHADIAIVGAPVPFTSLNLRVISLFIYSLFLVPGLNLLIPMVAFLAPYFWHHKRRTRALQARAQGSVSDTSEDSPRASKIASAYSQLPEAARMQIARSLEASVFPVYICLGLLFSINIIFIADIELTLQRNDYIQERDDTPWNFGQVLAMRLLFLPLRDVLDMILARRQRRQERQIQGHELRWAIYMDDSDRVARLVKGGVNPNGGTTHHGKTALQVACEAKDWGCVRTLVEHKADLTVEFNDGRTVLDAVTIAGELELLKDLLKVGAPRLSKAFGKAGRPALHLLCEAGSVDILRIILSHGVDANLTGGTYQETGLHVACQYGKEDVVLLLLEHGADPWSKSHASTRHRAGGAYSLNTPCTPLYEACSNGHLACAKHLISVGAHRNEENPRILYDLAENAALRFRDTKDVRDLEDALFLRRANLEQTTISADDRADALAALSRDLEKLYSAQRESATTKDNRDSGSSRHHGADSEDSESESADSARRRRQMAEHAEEICSLKREVLALYPASGSDDQRQKRAKWPEDLAWYLGSVYESLDDPHILDETLALERERLTLYPSEDTEGEEADESTYTARADLLERIAWCLTERHRTRGALSDLREAINARQGALTHYARARADPGRARHTLDCLAADLGAMFAATGDREDLAQAVSFGRQAARGYPKGHRKRPDILERLAWSLRAQYHFAWRVSRGRGEVPAEKARWRMRRVVYSTNTLVWGLTARYRKGMGKPADVEELLVIEQELLDRCGKGNQRVRAELLDRIAWCFTERFRHQGGMHDVREAVRRRRQALAMYEKGPGREAARYVLWSLSENLVSEYVGSGDASALAEAAGIGRELVDMFPPDHAMRLDVLMGLARCLTLLYEVKEDQRDLKDACRLRREVIEGLPKDDERRWAALNIAASDLTVLYNATKEEGVFEEAVVFAREAVATLPAGHPDRFMVLDTFAMVLYLKPEQYLDKALYLSRKAVSLVPAGDDSKVGGLVTLLNGAAIILGHYKRTKKEKDRQEAINLWQKALAKGSVSERLKARMALLEEMLAGDQGAESG